jgi:hypothetical protein
MKRRIPPALFFGSKLNLTHPLCEIWHVVCEIPSRGRGRTWQEKPIACAILHSETGNLSLLSMHLTSPGATCDPNEKTTSPGISDMKGMTMVTTTARQTQTKGICTTCNYLDDCNHRLNNGLVIWQCDQFDDFVPQKPLPHKATPVAKPSKASSEEKKLMGLCVNCEHRKGCVHAQREGGVWHCEEYA